ncbi:MAG: MGMT family protein [Candidatus Altiarchaeota archaeon]
MDERIFRTKFGWMVVAATEKGICRVALPVKGKIKATKGVRIKFPSQLRSDMIKYFRGGRVDFKRYPADLTRCTRFQKLVLSCVRKIPYGTTMTYSEVARKIGKPKAARAVGGALNANPLPLLIPCHRVTAAKGLGGFACGAGMKKRMLEMEGVI